MFQGLFEGLKAYKTHNGNIVLFRPKENALRMISGAERMCMSAPTVNQFLEAVKEIVLANERWVYINLFWLQIFVLFYYFFPLCGKMIAKLAFLCASDTTCG